MRLRNSGRLEKMETHLKDSVEEDPSDERPIGITYSLLENHLTLHDRRGCRNNVGLQIFGHRPESFHTVIHVGTYHHGTDTPATAFSIIFSSCCRKKYI